MWKATILGNDYKGGVLTVSVRYAQGPDFGVAIDETIDMTGGDLNTLNLKIASRLDTLNASDALVSQLPAAGDFTPVVVVDPDEALNAARKTLIQLQQDVDLGIIKTTDQVYIDALSSAQSAYSITTATVQPEPLIKPAPVS